MNKALLEGKVADINIKRNTFTLEIKRTSGVSDYVPVQANDIFFQNGDKVFLMGAVLTEKINDSDGKEHKRVYVNTNCIMKKESDIELNAIEIDGYLVQKQAKRLTPLGREIIDFTIAVNYTSSYSAYIPCIAWGKLAKKINEMPIGEALNLKGRFQSRDYTKNGEIKTAYEISVYRLFKVYGD